MNTYRHKHITFNLDEACSISKSELREYVSIRLSIKYPEARNLLTKRLLIRCLIYLEGYSTRLKEEMVPPVDKKDAKTLLLSEGFKYIWKRIEQK